MARIALLCAPPGLEQVFSQVTGGKFVNMAPQVLPDNAATFTAALHGALIPEIVVVSTGNNDPQLTRAAALTQELTAKLGCLVIFASEIPERVGLQALRSGVIDVIGFDIDAEALHHVMLRAVERLSVQRAAQPSLRQAAPEVEGRVIAVVSAKGGVGKTLVATNLAVGLAQRFPQSVVLVDLDRFFGDCAAGLGFTATLTGIPDLTQSVSSGDVVAVKTMLARHESGLLLAPASDSPAAADTVSLNDIADLLTLLSRSFQFVVVDTAPGMSEYELAVIEQASELVMVARWDVTGVRALRKQIETMQSAGLLVDRRHVVLNHVDTRHGLSLRDVQAAIHEDVDIKLETASAVVASINEGVPLLASQSRHSVAKQLTQLVDRVVGKTPHHVHPVITQPVIEVPSLEVLLDVEPEATPVAPVAAPVAPLPAEPTPAHRPVVEAAAPVHAVVRPAAPAPEPAPVPIPEAPAPAPVPVPVAVPTTRNAYRVPLIGPARVQAAPSTPVPAPTPEPETVAPELPAAPVVPTVRVHPPLMFASPTAQASRGRAPQPSTLVTDVSVRRALKENDHEAV